MKKITLKRYTFYNILLLLVSFCLFEQLFFGRVPSCNYLEVVLLLVASFCFTFFSVIMLDTKKYTYLIVVENLFLTWGIFAFLVYGSLYKTVFRTILCVAFIIYIALMIIVFSKKKKMNINYALKVAKKFYSYVSIIIVVFVIAVCALKEPMYPEEVYTEKDSLANNIDVIALFEPSVWATITDNERLLACKTLVDVEGRYYGLPYRISVEISALSADVIACYDPQKRTIFLDNTTFDMYGFEVIGVLCHEVYHAYSWELVGCLNGLSEQEKQLLFWERVSLYEEEMKHYENASSEGYFNQVMELDAFEAGERESMVYCVEIMRYWEKDTEIDVSQFSTLSSFISYYKYWCAEE